MANPNPGPLSKWIFIITMVGAVAYIGAAFSFVILPTESSSETATVENKTVPPGSVKGKASQKTTQSPKAQESTKTEKAQQPNQPETPKKPNEGDDAK